MAPKQPGRGRARVGLLLRVLGATGLFMALLGLMPLAASRMAILPPLNAGTEFDAWKAGWDHAIRTTWAELPSFSFSDKWRAVGIVMLLGGGVVFLVVLILRALSGLSLIAGRRNVA